MKKLDEVVIGTSDVECVSKFYENFGFKMPSALKHAIADFDKEQTLSTQRELKKQLTLALVSIEDPALEKLFQPVLDACKKSACEMQFEDDIDDMLAKDKE